MAPIINISLIVRTFLSTIRAAFVHFGGAIFAIQPAQGLKQTAATAVMPVFMVAMSAPMEVMVMMVPSVVGFLGIAKYALRDTALQHDGAVTHVDAAPLGIALAHLHLGAGGQPERQQPGPFRQITAQGADPPLCALRQIQQTAFTRHRRHLALRKNPKGILITTFNIN